MAVVTTSIVVSFDDSTGGDSIFSVEVDSREDGLNGGKTNFLPGDDVYLLMFKSSNVVVDAALTSKGSVNQTKATTKDIDEYAVFAAERESSLSYPVPSSYTFDWIGDSNLGGVHIANESKIVLNTQEIDLPEYYVGVGQIKYSSPALVYKLSGTLIPNLDSYQIALFFAGHTV